MSESEEPTRGGLGRLFAALVGGSDDDSLSDNVKPSPDGNTSVLDLEGLSRSLVSAGSPIAKLVRLVRDVLGREKRAGTEGNESVLAPSPFELHLARRLEDAGVLDDSVALPRLHAVRTVTSDLFYLRVDDETLSYAAKLKILRIEAALNGALLAAGCLEDPDSANEEDLVRLEQRIARSIVSQAGSIAPGGDACGEWGVRHVISKCIEELRLPYRLNASWRTNVSAGCVAIQIDLIPPSVFPATAYVDGIGVVPASSDMRRRAATDYNLRIALLLSSFVLATCQEVSEVWVAGVMDTATSHSCYYSARITREDIGEFDLTEPFDPVATMYALGVTMDESRGILTSVKQGFSLEDERFCPARRYDEVELSPRPLEGKNALGLGCTRVRDLGIDETAARRAAARDIMRGMGSSTEENVRLILAHAGDDEPADVREAAYRCMSGLIEGTISEDPCSVADAFVDGDALTKGTLEARDHLMNQDVEAAETLALKALEPPDSAGAYIDTGIVSWRAFGSYVDRALYNRMLARKGTTTMLVPAGYYEAHMIASAAQLAQGKAGDATRHARRAARIAPLSVQSSLSLVRCLLASGDTRGARGEACRMLSLAHEPEGLGTGYLHMAALLWQDGDVLGAQACYQRARKFVSMPTISDGVQVLALLGQANKSMLTELSDAQVESILANRNIPIAPTAEVSSTFFEAMEAATDAEIFPVARAFLETLGAVTRDDVYFGMLRSLEYEPDR